MRLFVAVDIDDETRAQFAAAREAMRSVLEKARVPPRVTWVKDEAAHVTVRFIGETPEDRVRVISEALGAGFTAPAFDMRWERLGTFPALRHAVEGRERNGRAHGRSPSVIWLGPSNGSAPLARLAQAVNERLDPLIGAGESRAFKPHVTIGRVKDPGRGVDWAQALSARPWRPTTTRVDHVTLYASRTTPAGAVYTALCKVLM